MLIGLPPRFHRLMQPAASPAVPPESQAEQFALDLLSDLVAFGDARSSVWSAQVELLADFVKEGVLQKNKDRLDDVHKHLEHARTREA
ncbi:MAG: hypothetical protein ABI983_10225 [Acidobacteriota bacterium]